MQNAVRKACIRHGVLSHMNMIMRTSHSAADTAAVSAEADAANHLVAAGVAAAVDYANNTHSALDSRLSPAVRIRRPNLVAWAGSGRGHVSGGGND